MRLALSAIFKKHTHKKRPNTKHRAMKIVTRARRIRKIRETKALMALRELFTYTAQTRAQAAKNGQKYRACNAMVDSSTHHCAMALKPTEAEKCTFHASPNAFKVLKPFQYTDDSVYYGSYILRDVKRRLQERGIKFS